ncbi:hypothetical protein BD626DRAFT_575710 [Schizophyllum amplum]|uniref:Uncharacterized protein n=1 Tax=Schizophyllum amplum TaxID=97359 RepID=A0A550BV02_9AGAR|nr:hypothetical protein BD626DRAFT_575710 [Auriculariopsis ampla]
MSSKSEKTDPTAATRARERRAASRAHKRDGGPADPSEAADQAPEDASSKESSAAAGQAPENAASKKPSLNPEKRVPSSQPASATTPSKRATQVPLPVTPKPSSGSSGSSETAKLPPLSVKHGRSIISYGTSAVAPINSPLRNRAPREDHRRPWSREQGRRGSPTIAPISLFDDGLLQAPSSKSEGEPNAGERSVHGKLQLSAIKEASTAAPS